MSTDNNTSPIYSHLFWGSFSPLTSLYGMGLLIMASARLSHALVITGSLLWVASFSVLLLRAIARILPEHGKALCQITVAAFFTSLYFFLIWVLCPVAALECLFIIALVPIFCFASGIFSRAEDFDVSDAFVQAFSEAAIMGLLVLLFALVREPIGFGSLTLPGGSKGMLFLFSSQTEGFFPIRIIGSSAGALLLLGYVLGLYRLNRDRKLQGEH